MTTYKITEQTKNAIQDLLAGDGDATYGHAFGNKARQVILVNCVEQIPDSTPPYYDAQIQDYHAADDTSTGLGSIWLKDPNDAELSTDTLYVAIRYGEYDPDPEGDSDPRPLFLICGGTGSGPAPDTCLTVVTAFDPDTCMVTTHKIRLPSSWIDPPECESSSMAMMPDFEAVNPAQWLRS